MKTDNRLRLTVLAFAVPVVMVLVNQLSAKEKADLNSTWVHGVVNVDGLAEDWTDLSPKYFDKQNAVIGVANDSTRLYLLWRFRDAKWARVIRVTGLKLTLQTPSREKRTFVLTYRGGPTLEQMRHLDPRAGSDRSDSVFPDAQRPDDLGPEDHRLFTCYIKDRIEEKEIPVDGSEGPAANFGMDQGMFVYEFSIPLLEGAVLNYGLGAEIGDRIKLSAVWGDVKAHRGRPGGGFGMIGGTEGGPPSGIPDGGMGGGRQGGGMRGGPLGGERPDMPEKQGIELNFSLARPAE
ncbi:MAG: hypothetical protein AB1772_04250 [Candidatus Zixiibacteriota bacterium]